MIAPGNEIQVEFSPAVGDRCLAMRAGECAEVDKFAALKQIDSVFGKSAPKVAWMQVFYDCGMGVVEIDAKGVAVPALVLVDQRQAFFGGFRASVAMPFYGGFEAY